MINQNFISIYDDILSKEYCDIIINEFESKLDRHHKGRVGTNTSFYGQGGKTKQQLESYFKGRPSSSTSALPTLNQSIDDQSGNSSFVPVVLPSSNVASAAGKVVVAPLGGGNNNYQRINGN